MPRRQRDYRAEYRKRQQRAQAEGWKSYSQKRTAKKRFEDDTELRRNWQLQRTTLDYQQRLPLDPNLDPQAFSAWYRGFHDEKERKDRGRDSPRARYVVSVLGLVPSFDDWEERYGPKK